MAPVTIFCIYASVVFLMVKIKNSQQNFTFSTISESKHGLFCYMLSKFFIIEKMDNRLPKNCCPFLSLFTKKPTSADSPKIQYP